MQTDEPIKNEKERDESNVAQPPSSFAITDNRLVDRIGTDVFFDLLNIAGSDELVASFQSLKKRDERNILNHLINCENVYGFQQFINSLKAVAEMADDEGAEKLVSMEAAEPNDISAKVAVDAFKNNKALFDTALKRKISESPLPWRTYAIYSKSTSVKPPKKFDLGRFNEFKVSMGQMYHARGWSPYCSPWQINNDSVIGVIVEHGSSKSGFSALQQDEIPITSLLRLRKIDIALVEKRTGMLWISTIARSHKFVKAMVAATGYLIFGDERAFGNKVQPSLSEIIHPELNETLRESCTGDIENIELRILGYNFGRDGRSYARVPGPVRNGCLTNDSDWYDDLPRNFKTKELSLAINSDDGQTKEEVFISRNHIKLSCSSSLPEIISTLQALNLVATYDH